MLGEAGEALTPIEPGGTGRVRTHGEIWNATADQRVEKGAPVVVTAVNGLMLHVRPQTRQTLAVVDPRDRVAGPQTSS